MPADLVYQSALGIDLSPRVQTNNTVVASPTGATETIVASLTVSGNAAVNTGILLIGFAAYTVGANGTSCNLKIRKTDASGSTLAATGVVNLTAADLDARTLMAFDSSPSATAQVYVLTATLAAATATSTFSAVRLAAVIL